MATILYVRVSTSEQNSSHQLSHAKAAGFDVEEVVTDHGVSGVKTRLEDRPQGRRLFDMLRKGDVLVVRWVDRLGRDYEDVTDVIRAFMKKGIIIRTVINSMTFDGATKDPMQQAVRDALIAFMAATAQAQAEATKEAQRVGLEQALADRPEVFRGRKPKFTRAQFEQVRQMLGVAGVPMQEIAMATGLSRNSVYRLRDDPARAERILATWEAELAPGSKKPA